MIVNRSLLVEHDSKMAGATELARGPEVMSLNSVKVEYGGNQLG